MLRSLRSAGKSDGSRAVKIPTAERRPQRLRKHGHTRTDPYGWLRNRDDPAVIAYLEAENEHTEQQMKGTKALQKKLFREIKGRIKETDLDVPVTIGAFSYYTRTVRGRQYPLHCRRPAQGRGREQILLDENELAKPHDFFDLGLFKVSPDHRYVAYSVDTEGNERYDLFVKDLRTGKLRRDRLSQVDSLAWSTDCRSFLYTVLDPMHRPHKVYRHCLGDKQSDDRLIHHEKNDAVYVSVSLSRSRQFLFIDLHAKTTSEVRYLPADRADTRPKTIEKRRSGVEYSVDHAGDYFYITHNQRATNFKLARAPVTSPGRDHWKTILKHRKDVLIEGVDLFENHLVVYERERALSQIAISAHDGKRRHRIRFDEAVYDAGPGRNPEFATDQLRYYYSSLITPSSVFEYGMNDRSRELLKQTPVLGGYRPSRYQSERVWATAKDGQKIPISLVYRRGMRRNGRNPTLLTAYGSYGASRDPVFSSIRLSLLDRGVVYAIAHIRGGSELGRRWYEHGKFLRKKNTFTDFIACAERLIRLGYTSTPKLAITGGSAGGLLMGAVLNMRPDLFGVALAAVPFVDVLNTMLDPTLPLTVTEYDEWGNPNDPRYFRYIASYAPYENVTAQDYPKMLVTAGLNDPRVGYWEPAKWVARLRETKTDDNELLLKTQMGSGHFGASGRYDMLKEIAFEYAYLLTRLGVEPDSPTPKHK